MKSYLFVVLAALAANVSAQLPKEAEPRAVELFSSQLIVSGQPADASFDTTARGVTVNVRHVGATPYSVQVMTDASHVPIHVNDVVFVTFESRSTTPGGGAWQMYAQQSSPPWTGYFNEQASPRRDWIRTNVSWTADKEIPSGTLDITFHVASQAQELEFRGFRAVDLGAYKGALPYTPITYAGREPDAAWRKEADRRIDLYRKTDLTVRVVDKQGNPVKGAKVEIHQKSHEYEFGSFVEDPLLWQNQDGERYRHWFQEAYNKATTPMYWADWGWEDPNQRIKYMKNATWLKSQGIRTKAHVLIYPGWQFLPARVKKFENDPGALWNEFEAHIREVLGLTKPFGFVSWDVTNETRNLKDLPKTFGTEDVYVRLFKLARKLAPDPILFLNENTILTQGGKTEAQQDEFERMLRYLISRGAPLGGIGMQAHFGSNLTPPTEIWRIVDRFAKFGLPIQITEFDLPIKDPSAQADYTRDLLTAWFAHPATTGFTMWGFWASSMWQPAGALVDKDWNVKPNGQAWLDLVTKRWQTHATLKTDASGRVKIRVFKGEYYVSSGDTGQQFRVVSPMETTLTVGR